MHKYCSQECGELVPYSEDNESFTRICNKCGRLVKQRKRRPNDDVRRIYLQRSEWELIAFAVDKAADTQVITNFEKFQQLIALKDKILEECKPRIIPKKKLTKKKKRRLKLIQQTINYENLEKE